MSVDHYENFPVASWLCPPRLRPAVRAIYWFARTADDLADEGDSAVEQRLADLAAYRQTLHAVHAGQPASFGRWEPVFGPLQAAIQAHQLPLTPLDDLLSAFMQDCPNPRYANRSLLLDYCQRSANPIGRLLLHLYGIKDAQALQQSDAICSALQLINFWQDLSRDLPRGRIYLPDEDLQRAGLVVADLQRPGACASPAVRGMLADLCDWARQLMHQGAPLTQRLPGRMGWELRLVVHGGMRILEKIAAMDHDSFHRRPTLDRSDAPLLLWRALTQPRP